MGEIINWIGGRIIGLVRGVTTLLFILFATMFLLGLVGTLLSLEGGFSLFILTFNGVLLLLSAVGALVFFRLAAGAWPQYYMPRAWKDRIGWMPASGPELELWAVSPSPTERELGEHQLLFAVGGGGDSVVLVANRSGTVLSLKDNVLVRKGRGDHEVVTVGGEVLVVKRWQHKPADQASEPDGNNVCRPPRGMRGDLPAVPYSWSRLEDIVAQMS